MKELFNEEYIQDLGRKLWETYYDNNKLHELPDAVADILAEHFAAMCDVDYDLTNGMFDMLAKEIVNQHLDVEALTEEANENTEFIHERMSAMAGQY